MMRTLWVKQFEERHLRGRRKATLFAVLVVLWVFPSLGAAWILWINRGIWREASTVFAAIQGTRLEQWVALGLLAAHGVFAWCAIHYTRHEPRLRQEDNSVETLPGQGPDVGR